MFGVIRLRAHAKINFCLDIVGVRNDGYHLLESVMQSLELHDCVRLKRNKKGIISVDCDLLIDEKDNIAYKAAKVFFEEKNIENSGVSIKIKKKIPEKAGLGGGSADAAAVLVGLNNLYGTKCGISELCAIGERLGADVPFCICGGTRLVRGIGEIMTPLDDCRDCYIVVVKGRDGVSTGQAYAAVERAADLESLKLEKVIDAAVTGNFSEFKGRLVNVFEQCTEIQDVHKIVDMLRNMGAEEAAMTGSGSAVFGIFVNKKKAFSCVKEMRKLYPFACLTRPSTKGVSRI